MQTIYERYVKEICPKCKNRETNLCEIRKTNIDGIENIRCCYYENEEPIIRKKLIKYWQRW